MTKISNLPEVSATSEFTFHAVVNAYNAADDSLYTATLGTYDLVNNALVYGIEDQSALLSLDNHIGWVLCGATGLVTSEDTAPCLFNPCLYYAMYSTSSASTSDVSDWYVPVCSEYADYPVDGVCKVPLSELMGGGITSEAFTDMMGGLDTFDPDYYGASIAYIPIYNYQEGTTQKLSLPSAFSAAMSEVMSDVPSVSPEYYSAIYLPAYVDDYDSSTAYLGRISLDEIPTATGLGNLISNVSEAYNILSDFAEYDNYIPMYLDLHGDSYLCKISLREIPTAEGFHDLMKVRLENIDQNLGGDMRIPTYNPGEGDDGLCGYITISALKAYLGL